MKTLNCSLPKSSSFFINCAMLAAALATAEAATFTNTPSVVNNAYEGFCTFQIGGLTNGQTVVIESFMDGNANGVVDDPDMLVQSFRLTDGVVATIGGATNWNVPSDFNSATGAITARLHMGAGAVDNFVGRHLYRLSSPGGGVLATSSLTVTNAPLGQMFTGSIKSGGSNVPYASVLVMTTPHGIGMGGAVADSAGAFAVSMPPGSYQLVPFKTNFVADMSTAPALVLSNGVTLNTNLFLLPATRTISGKVRDAANTNLTLPGMLTWVQSTNGQAAIGSSDANGNYSVGVAASLWRVEVVDFSSALHGYVTPETSATANTTSGNATGVDCLLTKATALFHGSLRDKLNNPIANIDFWSDDAGDSFESSGRSDPEGNYAVATTPTNWWVGVASDDPAMVDYVVTSGTNTLFTSNLAVRVDFFAKHATHRINGSVLDTGGNPVPGLSLQSWGDLGGQVYQGSAETKEDGSFSLPAVDGAWNVQVECEDDDGLQAAGYCCADSLRVVVGGADGTANFIATQAGEIAINTGSLLPPATQGSYYYLPFSASSCLRPFTWTNLNALPAGLTLSSSGVLSGVPTAAGSNTFSVRVKDSGNYTTNATFHLVVAPPPLQITTSSPLPDGTQGAAYDTWLQASGGTPPYSWTNLTSLPAGLNLAPNGLLSGTPTVSDTFDFTVRVTDAAAQIATTDLSVVILPTDVPDVVSYYVTKVKTWQQLDAGTLILNSNMGPFQILLGLVQSATNTVPIANVTLPTGAVRGLPFGNTDIHLASHESYVDEAAFETDYPSGDYTFGFYAIHDGLQFLTLNLPTAAYPAVPRISNLAAAQAVHPANPFTLQWDPLAGATAYDPLWLVIYNSNALPVFSTPHPAEDGAGALKATATSVLITNAFEPGRAYLGALTYFKATTVDTTSYPGAVGLAVFGSQTWFLLTTRSAVPTLSDPVRINPNVFRFTVHGLAGQNYTIQASTNLLNWNTIRTTNAPADVFTLQLNQATSSHSAYRLKVEP